MGFSLMNLSLIPWRESLNTSNVKKIIFSSKRNSDDDWCEKLLIEQNRSFFNGAAPVTCVVE